MTYKTRLTVVHGKGDSTEQIFDEFKQAYDFAERFERDRCGRSLEGMKERFTYDKPDRGLIQYGTDYHYVMFERLIA